MHVNYALQRDSKLVLCAEKFDNLFQNLCVRSRSIIEAWSINQRDFAPADRNPNYLTLGSFWWELVNHLPRKDEKAVT